MFTIEELQNLLVIINRANITGQEAIFIVRIQQKIGSLMQEMQEKNPKKEEKK